jgi:hypothetical protein
MLQYLQLEGCDLHVDSLPFITASKHLQQLHLVYVKLIGDIETVSESAPPVVTGPPSLALFMEEFTASTSAARAWLYSLLRWLGPRLRSIEYMCSDDSADSDSDSVEPVQQVLQAASEGHLAGLRRLFVTNSHVEALVAGLEVPKTYLEMLPGTCPSLEHLRLDNVVLTDAQLLSVLMAMPALQHLELFAVDQEDSVQPEPAPLQWPGQLARSP